jgi:hypothetical protein
LARRGGSGGRLASFRAVRMSVVSSFIARF